MFGKKSKKTEEERNESRVGIFEEIVDNLPVALFAKDASDDFRFILWNKKQEEITTIKSEDAIGKKDSQLFSPDSAEYFREMDEAVIKKGRLVTIPEEIVDTEGAGEVYLRTLKLPIFRENRTIVVGISEDITDRVKGREQLEKLNRNLSETNRELEVTQLQLIQAEKLESIGRLAAGVAHEVKNPLALLVMGVEYLSSGIKPDDPNVPVILAEMNDAIARADRIVRGLVDLSSNRKVEKESTDPVELCEHVLLLLRHEVNKHSVTITKKYDCEDTTIQVDRGKFEQVFLNVITNAIHAMTDCESPELSISIRSETLANVPRNEGARDAHHLRSGDHVVIFEITDNGSGIATGDMDKIFDPFFTTKATGAGTGLGLSVVRKIVQLHEGRFSLTNRQSGSGACAKIMIPSTPKSLTKGPFPQTPGADL